MDIFNYVFMQRAFLVGIALAVILPCIGVIIVLKRLSMIGDALSHSSLAGVEIGLLIGFNPLIGSLFTCVIAALTIEFMRKKFPRYAELSIAIVMSTGIGLAGILSGFIKNTANFNSFLFGSIVAISPLERTLVLVVSSLVFLLFIALYRELFLISLDEQCARLLGVPLHIINFLFTLLTALSVAVAARTVGALVVSSILVVPVACAIQIAKSYKQTVCFSIGLAIFFTIVGLFLSYYQGLKPGGTIVLTGIATLLLIIFCKSVYAFGQKKFKKNSIEKHTPI